MAPKLRPATKTWHTTHHGDLVLTLKVEIEGLVLQTTTVVTDQMARFSGPSAAYIEQDMERQILRKIGQELFGR